MSIVAASNPQQDEGHYGDYWSRKHRLQCSTPHFPVVRWWSTDQLCPIEQIYFQSIEGAEQLLDVGAGDLRIKDKMLRAGFAGKYHTLDVNREYEHDFNSLDDVTENYDAILCLDVIEHLPLAEGLAMLDRLFDALNPGGVLVLQTPNARCIRSPYGWDMTHLHTYNLPDLWSYCASRCSSVIGRRVWFTPSQQSLSGRLLGFVHKAIVTRILGLDYADNIAVIARR